MENKNVNEFLETLTEEQRTALLACKTEEEVEKVIDDYDIDLPDEMLEEVAGGRGLISTVLAAVMLLTSSASIVANAAEDTVPFDDTQIGITATVDTDNVEANASLEAPVQLDDTQIVDTDNIEVNASLEAPVLLDSNQVGNLVGVVSGGNGTGGKSGLILNQRNTALNDYLKSIAPSNKGSLLVQEGDGSKFDTSNYAQQEGSNFVVVTRRLESLENNNADLATLEGTVGNIYPGAIVHADGNLVDGCPNILPIEDENRQPLPLYLDISGNTISSQTVNNVSFGEVNPKINEMLNSWFKGSKTVAAKATYQCIMVHSEKQVDLALGVEGAAKKYGVDAKACMKGEKQEMLVVFNQLYYTVRTPQTTAASLFAMNVKPSDLQNLGVDAQNPGLAEVTSISYGRQIIVKLETDSTSTNVETAWRASIGATGIEASAKYKDIMENTSYSVCAYGGNPSTVGKLMQKSSLSNINEALTADLQFTASTPAVPLSYSTTFIDDATNATVKRATEYVAITRQVRKPITYKVDSASMWSEKSQCLYGRKIVGIDEKGNLKLGGWEKICSDKGDVEMTNISGAYAEFGFEVDIKSGTDWPYSDVFWRVDNGVVDKIEIDTGGTCRMANVKIKVNGNTVYSKTNCSSHDRYNW